MAGRATGRAAVYRFDITLQDTDPAIWRRIETNDVTLEQLHEQIQTAMGWTNHTSMWITAPSAAMSMACSDRGTTFTCGIQTILTRSPFHEPGDLGEVWETQQYLDAAVRVRDRLMSGDLRALYLLWLCAADDDDNDPAVMIEPPVPLGISDIADHGGQLLWFFGLDPRLLVSAGKDVDAAPTDESWDHASRWVNALDEQPAKDLLLRFSIGDTVSVKASLLAEIRDSQTPDAWPTSDKQRSLDELFQKTAALRAEEDAKQARKAQAKAKREAAKAERERADRMKEMLQDPDKWLRQAERLVDARGTHNYQAAAEILHDLREVVGGEEGEKIARRYAVNLAKKHPTLNHLKNSLRKRGLLES